MTTSASGARAPVKSVRARAKAPRQAPRPARKPSAFKVWMQAAGAERQTQMAQALGTSRQYLYHISNGHRGVGPEMAGAIEEQTAIVHDATGGMLPIIRRVDLSPVCRACPHAQACGALADDEGGQP